MAHDSFYKWNWQQKDWPNFRYDEAALEDLEYQFIQTSGVALGSIKHIDEEDKIELLIEVLSDEALTTSAIEGEYLDRGSIQESIKKNLGLETERKKLPQAEFGISKMMVNLYRTYAVPLTHEQVFEWYQILTNGRWDLKDIGRYRTHEHPMQVVSGRLDKQTVHYEAPPSSQMTYQMKAYVR